MVMLLALTCVKTVFLPPLEHLSLLERTVDIRRCANMPALHPRFANTATICYGLVFLPHQDGNLPFVWQVWMGNNSRYFHNTAVMYRLDGTFPKEDMLSCV